MFQAANKVSLFLSVPHTSPSDFPSPVWNARVNQAPWFAPKGTSAKPAAPADDRFTRLPPPVSSRRHKHHFSSPVAFFTRKNTDAEARRPVLRHQESGSSQSVTTEESSTGYDGPTTYTPGAMRQRGPPVTTGTGFASHSRSRSAPVVPAVFGSAARKNAAPASMVDRPPVGQTPSRRPSASGPAPAVPAKSTPSKEKAMPPTPLSRNASASAAVSKPPLNRAVSASRTPGAEVTRSRSRGDTAARATVERRPTTTRPPIVYVPTPPSTHAWQKSPAGSTDAVTMPPIAARMMAEQRRGVDRGRPPTTGAGPRRKGSTSRDRAGGRT